MKINYKIQDKFTNQNVNHFLLKIQPEGEHELAR